MMITEGIVKALIEEKLEGSDHFVVSAKVLPGNKIRVFIDGLTGLNVKDCVAVSRHIEGSLDRDVEDYELQVSSPGLTEPFQHPVQYKKNVGRSIKVTTTEGESWKGELMEFDGENVTIQPEKKKKEELEEPITISLELIKEAKTVISF
jgi:ribosome maturation factor RimP